MACEGARLPILTLLLALAALGIAPPPAAAQPSLTAYVTRSNAPKGTRPEVLVPGSRVQAASSGWTEVIFSDSSSIVLESGAAFSLQSVGREAGGDQVLVKGTISGGRVRVTASERTTMALQTGGGAIEVG